MTTDARPGPSVEARIVGVTLPRTGEAAQAMRRFDRIATEEPLEIRLRAGGTTRTVAITMRTPGHDFELAAGFLAAEGVLAHRVALRGLSFCVDPAIDLEQRYNIVNVDLSTEQLPDLATLERHFLTTSACGVCGRAGIESLARRGIAPLASDLRLAAATLAVLPERLRAAQGVFEKTGGLHAAGIFDSHGELVAIREDVGRHNALDKLIGWALLNDKLPLSERVLLVSGRTSYEIVQKAIVAGVPIVAAISAPSSLAVDLARAFGVTLAGFVRGSRFNLYTNEHRIPTGG